jgi:hypothetical protein
MARSGVGRRLAEADVSGSCRLSDRAAARQNAHPRSGWVQRLDGCRAPPRASWSRDLVGSSRTVTDDPDGHYWNPTEEFGVQAVYGGREPEIRQMLTWAVGGVG